MPADVQELIHMHGVLKAQRQPWEATWQRIADVCLPAFNDIQTRRTPGQLRTQQLFDNTGLHGCIELANHFAGSVTNFQTQWFGLRMTYEALNEQKPVILWLDMVSKAMQDKMASTTTPQSFHEMYLQFVGFGTGALFTDSHPLPGPDGSHGIMSRSLPIGTYSLAEDIEGVVDTVYRDMELSPRQAIQHFGADQVHEAVRTKAETAEGRHTPSAYLHAVYPRRDRQEDSEAQQDMAYASCYVDVANRHVVSEGGYRWCPYTVSRWQKLRAWSPYGFGPGHIALPEMMTVNGMDMDILKGLRNYVLPSWWTDDPDAAGRVSLLPGMVNPIARGAQIQPMRGQGDFNLSHLGMEERRARIRKAFYVDELRALPPVDEPGNMTAYEVSQRLGLTMRLMGPALMRLLSEFLNPFIDIYFGLMLENNELPEPPDLVIEAALAGYGKLTVDYQGPLARAQRHEEIQGYENLLSTAERYYTATEDKSVYDNFSIDEILQRSSKIWGVSPVMHDAAERARIRQERAEAAAEAAQAQAMREDAQAMGQAAPMVRALMPATPEGQAA